MASYQYIFVMQNLGKVFPGGKELFKNIKINDCKSYEDRLDQACPKQQVYSRSEIGRTSCYYEKICA